MFGPGQFVKSVVDGDTYLVEAVKGDMVTALSPRLTPKGNQRDVVHLPACCFTHATAADRLSWLLEDKHPTGDRLSRDEEAADV